MGCLNSLKPRILEVIMLAVTVIAIGFLIWGIVDIPWDDIKVGGKIFFYIGCGMTALVFLMILILMCIRIGNKINESQNGMGKCLCITSMICNIIGLIAFIIGEIIIFINMDDARDDYYEQNYGYEYGYRRHRRWDDYYSHAEWGATVCSITAGEIALAINIFVLNFLIKVVWAKTNLAYYDYLDSQNVNSINEIGNIQNDNTYTKSINVYNIPPNNNQNMLKFIGYDKDGHPIYSGTAQYYTPNNIVNNGAKK